MRSRAPSDSFERFYYTNVALGEGCGCAEKVIDVYDAKAVASASASRGGHASSGLWQEVIEAFVIRYALITGKKTRNSPAVDKKRS